MDLEYTEVNRCESCKAVVFNLPLRCQCLLIKLNRYLRTGPKHQAFVCLVVKLICRHSHSTNPLGHGGLPTLQAVLLGLLGQAGCRQKEEFLCHLFLSFPIFFFLPSNR